MGILRIHTEICNQQPELLDACNRWLRKECKASIKLLRSNGFVRLYAIEGEGIPAGEKEFAITIEKLCFDNVLMININE